tara:strand:- start:201 stop:494 length:294 start_codon:yes stop_codon:yes gene_type:complete
LNKINIKNKQSIRITTESTGTPEIQKGPDGPIGPTGPTGPDPDPRLTRYYYGTNKPSDGITGDKWFWTTGGIEFTKLQEHWIQLYPLFTTGKTGDSG